MCASQFVISASYITRLKTTSPDTLQSYIEAGIITENNGVYSTSNSQFIYFKDPNATVPATVSSRGLVVETTTLPNAPKTTSTSTVDLAAFDESLRTYLVQQGIVQKIDDKYQLVNGKTMQNLQTVVNEYYQAQPSLITFDENTDQQIIQKLVTQGAIEAADGGKYKVLNSEAVNAVLTIQDSRTETPRDPVTVGVSTTTVTEEQGLQPAVPQNLRNNKSARRQLEADYRQALTEWANDPENEVIRTEALANMRYHKKIEKRIGKIQKEYPTNAAILNAYFSPDNKYATENDRNMFTALLEQAKNLDDATLLRAFNADHNRSGKSGENLTAFTTDAQRQAAMRSYIASQLGGNGISDLILDMAIEDVMSSRSARRVRKDNEYFIEEMAQREVEKDLNTQNFNNTTVHFSRADKRDAERNESNPNAIHTQIGRRGRQLVESNPEMFCTPDGTAEDYDVKKEVNGQTVYYRFSSQKWKDFFANASDSNSWNEDTQMGNDPNNDYVREYNLTLNEARSAASVDQFTDASGNLVDFETLMGNGNGNVGNRELNRYRNLARTTGLGVETNHTGWKRALHVGKDALIGGAIGFGTGYISPWLAPAVSIAGVTGGEMLEGTYTTEGRFIDYSGKTGSQTISHTFNTTINGETFSSTVSHTLQGQEYSGQVYAPGQSGTVEVYDEGDAYSGSGRQDNLRTATNAGLLGTVGGAIKGLFSMKNVNDKGTYWDGVINLRETRSVPSTSNEDVSISIPPSVVEVRSGQMVEESEIPTLASVRYRGPAAYAVLYETVDGKPVDVSKFTRAIVKAWRESYRQQTGQETTAIMPDQYFLVYDQLTLDDGTVIKRKNNYQDVYRTITEGTPGSYNGFQFNSNKSRTTYSGRGTITS